MSHRSPDDPSIRLKWPAIRTACLLVILDNYDHNYDCLTNILKYINTKLKDCSISLNKTFIITLNDYNDLVRQFNYLIENDNGFIFLTCTSDRSESAMFNLINDSNLSMSIKENILMLSNVRKPTTNFRNGGNSKCLDDEEDENVIVYDSRILLIKKKSFHFNVAIFFNRLLIYSKETKLYFNFHSATNQNNNDDYFNFFKALTNFGVSNLSSDSNKYGCLQNNTCLVINRLFSNYFPGSYIIELISISTNPKLQEFLQSVLAKHSAVLDLMIDNYINADCYVLNFEKHLVDANNNELERPDLSYLLNKMINLSEFKSKLNQTIGIIEEALSKYSQDETCISFNGGKDCCVVLYLYYAIALRSKHEYPINVLYIKIENQFDEMEFFIEQVLKNFYRNSLNFITFEDTSKSLKASLTDLKKINPRIRSIFMGTRRTDGDYFKDMPVCAPTDKDWPSFMRISPIMEWSFSEIWLFIRLLKLPYCSLYDKGYTSIDNSLNTIPNEALLFVPPDQRQNSSATFLPAYMLNNQNLERNSRLKRTKKQ